jgi:hypothetical protein
MTTTDLRWLGFARFESWTARKVREANTVAQAQQHEAFLARPKWREFHTVNQGQKFTLAGGR